VYVVEKLRQDTRVNHMHFPYPTFCLDFSKKGFAEVFSQDFSFWLAWMPPSMKVKDNPIYSMWAKSCQPENYKIFLI
jgi:hypothetical protein